MKKKIRFIYNPISGLPKHKTWEDTIQSILNTDHFEYEVRVSEYAGHSIVLAKEAAELNYDIVCAIGGDGTVNEVINGIVGTSSALAIIPTGSGNGLSNHIKLKPRKVTQALQVINNCRIEKIDLVKTNVKWFSSVSGIGYEAHITKRFRQSGKRGFISYLKASIFEFFGGSLIEELSIDIDANLHQGKYFMFSVFNSNQYGYDVGFPEDGSIHDGKLDIVLLKPFPIYRLPLNLMALFFRKPKWTKDITQTTAQHIKVLNDKKLLIQIDGDPMIIDGNLEYQIYPSSLPIIIPSNLKKW